MQQLDRAGGYLDRLAERLAALERQSLRRTVRVRSDYAEGELLDFSSNDYLGLSQHPAVVGALRSATRVGSGGSRLLAGAFEAHRRLEEELAAFTGREKALLFSSGYHAAIGAIGGLAGVVSAACSDELNHACLIDGLRLTRLERRVYPHRRFSKQDQADALIVTESLFGVDGDAIDVAAILREMGPNDVLLVDEAHALGVAGEHGAGFAYGIDDPRLIVMGTLSKAFGALGGFVAGPRPAIEYLESVARTFIFDTALPPAVAEAACTGVRLAREADRDRAHLVRLGTRLRGAVQALGFRVPDGVGPIVPIVVGPVDATLDLAARLRQSGINAPPIRPPTVPAGTSRLRVTLRATHTDADVDRLVAALARG
jgi:8-amino-7-oxononanoate synthase